MTKAVGSAGHKSYDHNVGQHDDEAEALSAEEWLGDTRWLDAVKSETHQAIPKPKWPPSAIPKPKWPPSAIEKPKWPPSAIEKPKWPRNDQSADDQRRHWPVATAAPTAAIAHRDREPTATYELL